MASNAADPEQMKTLRLTIGSLLSLCFCGKLDVDSFVHGLGETKKCFLHPNFLRDEFSQSLVEQVWIKQAELQQSDKGSLEAFRTSMKPILS